MYCRPDQKRRSNGDISCNLPLEPNCASIVPMRMKSFRRFVLLWMIAWLPIAGVRAAVMPIEAVAVPGMAVAYLGGAVQQMLAMPCHTDDRYDGNDGSGSDTPDRVCSHCELCHIASALATSSLASPVVAPSRLYASVAVSALPSFIPELLVPPPRSPSV